MMKMITNNYDLNPSLHNQVLEFSTYAIEFDVDKFKLTK